jgi:hypothetical protein
MKKPFRNTILLLVASTFILTGSCKKYPDGPLISLRTKEHRIAGTWDVEYFSINGFDSTSYLKSQPFYGMYFFGIKNGNYIVAPALYGHEYPYLASGSWTLKNHKKDIEITFGIDDLYSGQIGPYRSKFAIWEIRRLTETEMWLRTIYSDGREYFVKFKLLKNL